MRWVLLGFAAVAVAVLLFWMRDDAEARRNERGEVRSPRPKDAPDESRGVEREEGERVTLRGVVVDEGERPIAGAKLEVWREEGVKRETATSDAEGRFGIVVRAQPSLAVHARHPDYVAAVAYYQVPKLDEERRIVLVRGAKYSLRVVGPDREPVAGAAVAVVMGEQRGVPGFWGWSDDRELAGGKTDAEGTFAVGALPLGRMSLKVEHSGFAVHREVLEVVNDDTVEHLVVLNRGGALEGTVLGPDEEPVAGARVFTDDREARSDESGRFRIERVGAGPATVCAEKEGLAPGFFGARLGWEDPVPIQVVAGETIPGIDVHLGVASWVVGRIVDEKGTPIDQTEIMAHVWGAFQLKSEFKSDEEGRFVAGPFHVTGEATIGLIILRTGFAELEPKPRALQSGERLDVGDLKMTTSPPIVGRVVDEDGNAVAGARVDTTQGWGTATTDADGRFEMSVPWPRKLTLTATGPGAKGYRSAYRMVDARPGKPRTEVVLTLMPPLSIRGTITDGEGNPRAGVTLIARRSDDPEDDQQAPAEWAHSDKEGRYEATSLSPGRYKIGIVGSSNSYDWGDTPWLEAPAVQEIDAGAKNVDFVFPYTGGIVTAKVVSKRTGRPIRRLRYGLIRYRMLLPRFSDAGMSEDRRGKFRAELDQEGTWAVEFQADGHASFRTQRFSLKKGESKDLGTIRLGEGATLIGQVRDAQGRPVPYTRINILSPKFETNDDEPFTGRDGRFRIPGISPGLYNVFAISPLHPIGMVRNISLREGQTHKIEVRFERSAPLEVRVSDPGGSPIRDAELSFTFAAIAPLTSRMFRDKIPPGFGSHKSDAEGRIFQRSLPAGQVVVTIEAQGFRAVTRQVRLTAGQKTRIEITLAPKK